LRILTNLSPALRGSLFYAVYWGAVAFLDPFPNVYFAQMGLNGRQIGIIGALLPLSALLFSPLISSFADRRGWRVRILFAFCLLFGLAVFFLGLPVSYAGIFLVSILIALVRTPIAPLGDGLISSMASRQQLNFGSIRLWGSFTFAIFASLAGFLWLQLGLKWMFPVTGALFVLVALCALLLPEDPPTSPHARSPFHLIRSDPLLVSLLVSSMLMGASNIMGYIFSSVYMAELGGGENMIGMFFGLPAFFEIPSLLFGVRLMRRWGDVNTSLLSFTMLGIGLLGYTVANQPWVMIIFALIRGIAWGLYFVSIIAIINKRTPPEMASTFLAILNACAMGIAPLIASPLAGLLYDFLGPRSVFIVGTGLCTLAIVVLFFGSRFSRSLNPS
jgi:PPP family 3-phenylpropionic acid transporter